MRRETASRESSRGGATDSKSPHTHTHTHNDKPLRPSSGIAASVVAGGGGVVGGGQLLRTHDATSPMTSGMIINGSLLYVSFRVRKSRVKFLSDLWYASHSVGLCYRSLFRCASIVRLDLLTHSAVVFGEEFRRKLSIYKCIYVYKYIYIYIFMLTHTYT